MAGIHQATPVSANSAFAAARFKCGEAVSYGKMPRLQLVEHYTEKVYGEKTQQRIPQKFEAVELVWEQGLALHPKWRPVEGPLLDFLRDQFKD